MLAGSAVVLREVRTDDLPQLHAIVADLETWELRSPRPPEPLTYERFVQQYAAPDHDGVEFVITAAGRTVGRCGLFGEDTLARTAEIGIALAAVERRRGHGIDALRLLVDFGFTRRNLRRIHLRVLASNVAALALYQRLGFAEEGLLREHCWVRGRYEDEVVMGLLRSEWAPSGERDVAAGE